MLPPAPCPLPLPLPPPGATKGQWRGSSLSEIQYVSFDLAPAFGFCCRCRWRGGQFREFVQRLVMPGHTNIESDLRICGSSDLRICICICALRRRLLLWHGMEFRYRASVFGFGFGFFLFLFCQVGT